jgi:alkylhydroperoxidase family enzyme
LPNATREQFPDDLKYVWDALARDETSGDGTVANIFRQMGNNPALLRAYLRLGNGLWRHSGLDIATRELVILRTAILHHSMYEWHQHVRIGRAAGLPDDKIRALHHWRQSDLFSDEERAIFAYVDALNQSDHPLDDVHQELSRVLPDAAVVGVNLLTGFYGMTASFLGAMEVEPEVEFVGWEL